MSTSSAWLNVETQSVVFCRSQRTLENHLAMDDEKITLLEQQLKSQKVAFGDMERKYEEVNI